MVSRRKITKTHQKKRGRPPAPKPSLAELRNAVGVECWTQLAPIVIDGNCDGHPPDLVQEAFVAFLKILQPNRNLSAALQARQELRLAYRQLGAAVDAYAHAQNLLHSKVFSDAADFARFFEAEPPPEGIGGFTLIHMLKMQPHLDALLAEKELMASVATHEPPTPPTDTTRSRLLSRFYAKGQGWRDALRIGRLMTWREIAMVSILAGQWPSVKEGRVSVAEVIKAEKKAIRVQATRMGIPVGSLSDERDELWGYVDFCSTHFFIRRAHATPFRIEGRSQHDPEGNPFVRRSQHRARRRGRRCHEPHDPLVRGLARCPAPRDPAQGRQLLQTARRQQPRQRQHPAAGRLR